MELTWTTMIIMVVCTIVGTIIGGWIVDKYMGE